MIQTDYLNDLSLKMLHELETKILIFTNIFQKNTFFSKKWVDVSLLSTSNWLRVNTRSADIRPLLTYDSVRVNISHIFR